MKEYDLVIWQTGRSNEKTPLTAEEVNDITAYLEQGGSFLLSGENAISGNEDWATRSFRLNWSWRVCPAMT